MSGFYIGYLPTAPEDVRKKVRKFVAGAIGTALAACAIIVVAQQPFSPAAFEYTQVRPMDGVLRFEPYPIVVVTRPGATEGQSADSRYVLVSTGKHGIPEELRRFNGKQVRFEGKLIYRAEGTAVEVMPGSLHVAATSAPAASSPESLGFTELTGEIVDSKCFLGVMNPGRSKVHRDCAVRCISGGIPPALLVEHGATSRLYLLADSYGNAMPTNRILDRVAEAVRVRGEVVREGDTYIIHAQSIDRH